MGRIYLPGVIVVEIAEGSTHDSVEWPRLGIPEVSVLSQVDQQYQHQKEHDATFHRDLRLCVDIPFLR
jgi:hypothetical protein